MYDAHAWWRLCKLWSFGRKLMPHYCVWIEFVVHCKSNSHGQWHFISQLKFHLIRLLRLGKCILSCCRVQLIVMVSKCLAMAMLSDYRQIWDYMINSKPLSSLNFWSYAYVMRLQISEMFVMCVLIHREIM